MAESTVRSAIYTFLSAVTNIGVVHDYERWATDWDTFIGLFKTTIGTTPQIRGWEIRQTRVTETDESPLARAYKIKGYLGVSDATATEKTFVALIEAIAAKFRADQMLGTKGAPVLGHDFIQVELIEERMFGSVLCHYCELALTCYEDKYAL